MTGAFLARRALFAGAALPLLPRIGWAAARKQAGSRYAQTLDRYRAPGPFPVKVANPLSFPIPAQKRDLLVRVTYPDPSAPSDGRPFPVVLFSHGALSSKDLYARIADHWASHGIVTIQPTHLDSESLGFKIGSIDPTKLSLSRIDDLKFLLDHLEDVALQSPALAGRLAADKIAVGGHSAGVATALALAGVRVKGQNGKLMELGDGRIKALISYNGVGPLPSLDDDWTNVKIPVFAATGTNDPSAIGDGVLRSWRWRLGAFERTAGTPRYGLSIAYGDHYYGGLICREGAGGKPDPDGLAITNALSTAFMDDVFEGRRDARDLLAHGDIAALTHDKAFLEVAGER